MKTLTKYDLWKSNFFSSFVPLRDAVNGDAAQARPLARELAPMLGFGLLTEVNSYTWRSPDVMLSTAQDHRFGMFSEQAHAWQATLGTDAIVFTTHPKNEPQTGTKWPDGDGYWTGTGSMPASAQQGRAAIHVYDPAFDEARPGHLRSVRLPRLHARLLPAGALRRGDHRRALGVRAQGQRLRRPLVAAHAAVARARPRARSRTG